MEGIMKRFIEARKSTSGSHSTHSSSSHSSSSHSSSSHSSTHHTVYVNTSSHSGGHLPLKTVLIIIGVIVAIIMAILILYCVVHHHEYKKARRQQSQEEPISHVKIGKKAALIAITFGLIELWRKKRRGGNFQPVRDVEEDKDVPLVPSQYDGYNAYEHNVYEGQKSGLYGEGGNGQRGFGPGEEYMTSDELLEERQKEKLMGIDR